jgi:hypothetical protein
MYDGDTVSNREGYCRDGFLENVDITKCPERQERKGLASFQDQGPNTKPQGNPAHPEFKSRSDDGIPSTPAPYSKTKISGGPKKPGTPA